MPIAFLVAGWLLAQAGPADPRAVVRQALHAVEADSVAPLEARWHAALARDSADRAAVLGLASLARLRYDYTAAEALYARLTTESGAVDPWTVWALLGQTEALLVRARWRNAADRALAAMTTARVLHDDAGETEALLGVAAARFGADARSADTLFERLARRSLGGDPGLRARVLCARASYSSARTAHREQARADATRGAQLARAMAEPRVESRCLLALANLDFAAGNVPAAGQSILRAVALSRAAHDRAALAVALQLGGSILTSVDNHTLARRYLTEALREAAASGNDWALAMTRLALGWDAIATFDIAAAQEESERARALFEAIGDDARVLNADENLAVVALQIGALADVRARLTELEARGRTAEDPSFRLRQYRRWADLLLRENRPAAALAYLDSARAVARATGSAGDGAALTPEFAIALMRSGDLAGAGSALDSAFNRPEQPVRHYQLEIMRAELLARSGDLDGADGALREAADRLDQWRGTLHDADLRLLSYQMGYSPADPDLGFATILERFVAAGRISAAFRYAEQRRARALYDRYRAGRMRGDTSTAAHARIPESRTTLNSVQQSLDDATALLEYVTGRGGEATTLFLVTRSSASAFTLPAIDSLAPRIDALLALLDNSTALRAPARELGRALLDTALATLPSGVTRLILIPDDVLHRLPFAALLDRDGHYLIERYAIALAPSAALASALLASRNASQPPSLLAFGDPTDPSPGRMPDSVGVPRMFAESAGLARLPASRDEVRAVARYFPRSDVRTGSAASESALDQQAAQFAVLHFATHAQVDDRSAERTALVLAPDSSNDGFVTPAELAGLQLAADLVVLSGCRTAGGAIVRGEGVQGLTAPLLAAGARAVLASQWAVGDAAAARFVEDVYRGLARHSNVADALRGAQLRAIRRGAAPHEWAAFTLVGDPLVTLNLRAPFSPLPLLVPLALLLVVLMGLGLRRRRARASG